MWSVEKCKTSPKGSSVGASHLLCFVLLPMAVSLGADLPIASQIMLSLRWMMIMKIPADDAPLVLAAFICA